MIQNAEVRSLVSAARAAGVDRLQLQEMLQAQMATEERTAFEAEVRSGRVLSKTNHAHLKTAAKSIGAVLKNHKQAVGNPDPNKVTDDQQADGTVGHPKSGDDGTQNSNSGNDSSGYQDGTGTRAEVTTAELKHDVLKMNLKAAKHARQIANRTKCNGC